MDAEVEGICGAGYGEVSPGWVKSRNGYRPRSGTPEPGRSSWRSRKAAAGYLLPGVAAGAAPSAERALATLVATSYLLGVSTRRVEKLAESFGGDEIVKVTGQPDGRRAGRHGDQLPARYRRTAARAGRRSPPRFRPGTPPPRRRSPLASDWECPPWRRRSGARGGRGHIPGRERRALPVRHRRGMGSRRGRRDADAGVVAAAPVSARGRVSCLTPPFRQDAAATFSGHPES